MITPPVSVTWTLSLALQPIDAFTKGPLVNRPRFTLNGASFTNHAHFDGAWFSFVNLDPGEALLNVEAKAYYPHSQPILIDVPAAPARRVSFVMKPRPSYPFPTGTTMIRGLVIGLDGEQPIVGARVVLKKDHLIVEETVTDEEGNFRGRYALWISEDTAGETFAMEVTADGFAPFATKVTPIPATNNYVNPTLEPSPRSDS